MIEINTKEEQKFIRDYFLEVRRIQIENSDVLVYSCISLYHIFEFDLKIISFLLHPEVLHFKKFTDKIELLANSYKLKKIMEKVILYETSESIKNTFMSTEDLNHLISSYRKLSNTKPMELPIVKSLPEVSDDFSY